MGKGGGGRGGGSEREAAASLVLLLNKHRGGEETEGRERGEEMAGPTKLNQPLGSSALHSRFYSHSGHAPRKKEKKRGGQRRKERERKKLRGE